ncbi:MAG: hypothetical protein HY331_13850 [Chloroflexi bacterium]|nr:hypothetical protein [Chloroflexota bacterium]
MVALPLHGRGGGGDGLLSAWRRAAGRVAVAAALALAVALGAEHQTLLTPSVAPPDEVAMLAPTPDEGTDGLSPADAALPAPGALNRMAELSGQERTEAVDFWTPPIQHVPVSPSLHRQPVERESSPVALSLRYLAKLQARAEAASDQPLPRRWSRSTVPETLSQRYLRVMSDE